MANESLSNQDQGFARQLSSGAQPGQGQTQENP